MERVDLEVYLVNPVGRWTAGDGWLHFCTTAPFLAGATIWGALAASPCQDLLRCITAAPERHAVLLDGQRLASLDAAGFALAIEYMARHRDLLSARIVRLAGVRPVRSVGAALPESLDIASTPYPAMIFSERIDSLRWLGCEDHASVIEGIERQALSLRPEVRVRSRLEQLILEQPGISREGAARSLGMSLRSLQRRLGHEGSTFQHELSSGRVRLAQRLMLESDASLARIALEAGFNSHAVFSIVFRKLTGESPSEWREARWCRPRRDSRPSS